MKTIHILVGINSEYNDRTDDIETVKTQIAAFEFEDVVRNLISEYEKIKNKHYEISESAKKEFDSLYPDGPVYKFEQYISYKSIKNELTEEKLLEIREKNKEINARNESYVIENRNNKKQFELMRTDFINSKLSSLGWKPIFDKMTHYYKFEIVPISFYKDGESI